MNNDPEGGGASPSTEPAFGTSTATDVSLREYIELNWRWQRRFEEERDRRYREVAEARAEALRIKDEGDKEALRLQRDNQTYKDEKANELREQIGSERGLYVTKAELKPLADYVTGQQGRSAGIGVSANVLVTVIGLVLTVTGIVTAIFFATH